MAKNIEKDLHSVYIDNELPPAYIDKYESLVKADAECAAEQSKMKHLHDLLREDAADITVDDTFLEESFARLQTKMKYHKTVSQTEAAKPKVYQFTKWGISFAAAAAVFALVFTPMYLRSTAKNQTATVSAIANTKIKPIAQNDITVDGNLDRSALSSIAVNGSPIQGATMTSTASPRTRAIELNDSLTSIDVFRPASANADNGLSIRIQISPMHDMRGEEEVVIPLPDISRKVRDR